MTGRPRWVLPGLALLVLALTAFSPAVTAVRGDGLTPVTARPSVDLVDSVGVGVHLGFLDTPYARADDVVDALQDLGVRHVRDEFRLDQPRQWQSLRTLGDAGIRSALVVGPRPDHVDRRAAGTPATNVRTIARELPGAVESIEGTNEWDLWGGPRWARDLRAWQRALYDAVKSDPVLADRPVLAPSIAMRENWPAAGSFSAMADKANAHLYPDGRQPGGRLAEKTRAFAARDPQLPLVLTETGYHNATGPASPETLGHPPVPEEVAAAYVPRLVAGTLAAGVERTYLYELLDQFPDPARVARERNFGLLRHDLSPKPAYVALRDLLRLASGGTGGAAGSERTDVLGVTVDDAPSDLRRLVLQRPDGSFLVLVWRDVSLWDVETRRAEPVRSASVTLRVDTDGPWQVHRPGSGPAPRATGSGDRVPLEVGGRLLAVVLEAP